MMSLKRISVQKSQTCKFNKKEGGLQEAGLQIYDSKLKLQSFLANFR